VVGKKHEDFEWFAAAYHSSGSAICEMFKL
jgi:hypothetical protein